MGGSLMGVGMGVPFALARAPALLARLIPQFNGTDNYATLDTPITFTGDFEVEFDFTIMTGAGVGSGILGNFASALAVDFLQLQNATSKMVIDTTDGQASIVETGFLDGGDHSVTAYRVGAIVGIKADTVVIISKDLTTISDVSYDLIGAMSIAAAAVVNILKGHILSVKLTDNSGSPVVTEHILDTKTPIGLTYTNFTDVDWHNYKYNSSLSRWDYQGSGIAGSQLMQFEGTATTPLSSSITVTGSTWEMNWEGLWVEHYLSGVGAYTYLAAPDGVPMRLDIHVPSSVTEIIIEAQQLSGNVPDISDFTSLATFRLSANKLTSYSAMTIPATVTGFHLRYSDIAIVSEVDQIFSDIADSVAISPRGVTVDTRNGTMAAPTGGATNPDIIAINAAGGNCLYNT